MEQKNISRRLKTLGGAISKNSPTLLTGLAVGGLITTAIFAARATPKAIFLLDKEYDLRYSELTDASQEVVALTKFEAIKVTWKVYIPAACMCAATIACIIGSNSINQRRNAALATVYGLTEVAFREYKEKVVETIGKNKELKIRDEISGDKIRLNPPGKNEVIFTGKGEVLCYDSLSGRYFKSDIEQIRQAINELNKTFLSDMWMSVNDLYYALGLASTKFGSLMGWNLDEGLIGVEFSAQMAESGEPCLVLNYTIEPKHFG